MADTNNQTDAATKRNVLAVLADALNRCRAENMRTLTVMAALDALAEGASVTCSAC